MGFKAMTVNMRSVDRVRFTFPPKTNEIKDHLFYRYWDYYLRISPIVKSISLAAIIFITASHIMRSARPGAEKDGSS
jgi:hypothetical protein